MMSCSPPLPLTRSDQSWTEQVEMMRDICVAKVYAIVRAIEPAISNGGGDEGW
jgi:hypothetical protein